MLSIEDAEARLLESTQRLGVERWPIEYARGRIAAHDVWSPGPCPPRAVAARRGFAVRHRDVPGRLEVWGSLDPEEAFEGTLGRRRAVRLEAGAPLPGDATAVVSDLGLPTDGDHVTIGRRVVRGEGVIAPGGELPDERPVVPAGTRLRAPQLLLLSSLGMTTVQVRRRPRAMLAPRRAHPMLAWLTHDADALGIDVIWAPAGAAPKGLSIGASADVIVHVGAHAPLPRGSSLIRNVAFSPGGELRIDRRDDAWVVRLEGSALGAWTGWRWSMSTLLRAWTDAVPDPADVSARLATALPRDPNRRRIWAVRRTRAEPADLVLPVEGDSSWSLRQTWGTLALEPGRATCEAGSLVRVTPWP